LYRKFCHLMVGLQRNLRGKAKWIQDEEELIRLLQDDLPVHNTDNLNVQNFLVRNQIQYDIQTELDGFTSEVDSPISYIYRCTLAGPTKWDRGFPFGSQYQIQFFFDKSNTLILTKVGLFVFHI